MANKPFSPKVSIKNAEKIAKQVAVIQKKADVQIKAIKKQAEQKIKQLKKEAKPSGTKQK